MSLKMFFYGPNYMIMKFVFVIKNKIDVLKAEHEKSNYSVSNIKNNNNTKTFPFLHLLFF